jgi:hypothetical protein
MSERSLVEDSRTKVSRRGPSYTHLRCLSPGHVVLTLLLFRYHLPFRHGLMLPTSVGVEGQNQLGTALSLLLRSNQLLCIASRDHIAARTRILSPVKMSRAGVHCRSPSRSSSSRRPAEPRPGRLVGVWGEYNEQLHANHDLDLYNYLNVLPRLHGYSRFTRRCNL